MAYIAFSDMSYEVAEGSGYVSITLLVMGEVSVEYTVVICITDGTAIGEYGGAWHSVASISVFKGIHHVFQSQVTILDRH